ncbi:MAG: ribonuclease P protein component [Holosporales bacterium]|nr:ribonuclease P protein component [Holosporales bacterium]
MRVAAHKGYEVIRAIEIPKTIKKRAEFVRVCRLGTAVRTRTVVSIRYENSVNEPLVGFTASKKVGCAVKRNRAKRRLRSIVREFAGMFSGGSSFVFIATPATVSCDFGVLRSDFVYCMRKLTGIRT